jgi:hypothetical protein
MKNMKKLFAMMLMLASVLFFACSDDEGGTLSPDEAKTELDQTSTDMATYMDEMENSDGMVALDSLMAKPYPFVVTKSANYTNVFKNIREYLLPTNYLDQKSNEKGVAEEHFNFTAWVGTYTWNATDQNWDIQSNNPSDKIIIHYPTEGSTSNNATLTIHSYEDVLITETDEYGTYTWYEPTNIVADIYLNDINVVDISMNATFETSGESAGEPISLDATAYLVPFEFTIDFGQSGTTASADVAIKYENSQIFSAGISAVFESDNMEESPVNISGYIQLLKVRVNASINVQNFETVIDTMNSDNPPYASVEEALNAINNEIDAYVTVDGVKAADIELAYDEATQAIDVVFVYSDGSTESASSYFESFATDLETFFTNLEEHYSTWG